LHPPGNPVFFNKLRILVVDKLSPGLFERIKKTRVFTSLFKRNTLPHPHPGVGGEEGICSTYLKTDPLFPNDFEKTWGQLFKRCKFQMCSTTTLLKL
jgi:hypothetical protein